MLPLALPLAKARNRRYPVVVTLAASHVTMSLIETRLRLLPKYLQWAANPPSTGRRRRRAVVAVQGVFIWPMRLLRLPATGAAGPSLCGSVTSPRLGIDTRSMGHLPPRQDPPTKVAESLRRASVATLEGRSEPLDGLSGEVALDGRCGRRGGPPPSSPRRLLLVRCSGVEGLGAGVVPVRARIRFSPLLPVEVHGGGLRRRFVQGSPVAKHVLLLLLHVGLVLASPSTRCPARLPARAVVRCTVRGSPIVSLPSAGLERYPSAGIGIVSGNNAGPRPTAALPRRGAGEQGVLAAEDALDRLLALPGGLAAGLRELARAAAPPRAAVHAAHDGEVGVDLSQAVALRRIAVRAVGQGGA